MSEKKPKKSDKVNKRSSRSSGAKHKKNSKLNNSDDLLIEEKEKYLRLFAEFENYKRRTNRERIELFSTASKDLVQSLLPVLDDFDRAITEIAKEGESEVLNGIKLIISKFQSILEQKGLSVIDVKIGDDFNADNHEAITQVPAPKEELKGKIIDIIEKGYKLSEKVIRFPKVVIGQ